jgi:hypothetical protein
VVGVVADESAWVLEVDIWSVLLAC